MTRWNELQNFDGLMLWKDTPILDFTIKDGEILKWEKHEENSNDYPIEFTYDFTPHGLNSFLENRLVPPTRQDLQRVLHDLGINEYNWDDIIAANYGLCTDDCYWFRQRGSNLVYDDIKIRD